MPRLRESSFAALVSKEVRKKQLQSSNKGFPDDASYETPAPWLDEGVEDLAGPESGFSDDCGYSDGDSEEEREDEVRPCPRVRRQLFQGETQQPNPLASPLKTPLQTPTAAEKQKPCSACVSADLSVRRLASDNLQLRGKVKKLEESLAATQKQAHQEHEQLVQSVAETHEKRIRILQEEYEARRSSERAGLARQLNDAMEKEKELVATIKRLEMRVQEFEGNSLRLKEALSQSHSQEQSALNQQQLLKEQTTAALSTVAQFAEKHAELEKALERSRNMIEDERQRVSAQKAEISEHKGTIESLRVTIKEMQTSCNALTASVAEKEQLLNEAEKRLEKIEKEKVQFHEVKEDLLRRNQMEHEKLSKAISHNRALEREVLRLEEELSDLKKQYAEALSIAQCAWEEAGLMKQEEETLRQRLGQQESTVEKLKLLTASRLRNDAIRRQLKRVDKKVIPKSIRLADPLHLKQPEKIKVPVPPSVTLPSGTLSHRSEPMPTLTSRSFKSGSGQTLERLDKSAFSPITDEEDAADIEQPPEYKPMHSTSRTPTTAASAAFVPQFEEETVSRDSQMPSSENDFVSSMLRRTPFETSTSHPPSAYDVGSMDELVSEDGLCMATSELVKVPSDDGSCRYVVTRRLVS